MKRLPLVLLALVLTSACTVNIDTGSGSSTGEDSSTSASSAPSLDSSGEPGASISAGWAPAPGLTNIMNLDIPGQQSVMGMVVEGDLILASVLDTTNEEDTNMALVYSTDAGATWNDGGALILPESQYPRGLALTDKGLVMVGVTATPGSERTTYSAVLASAAAPNWQLTEVPAGEAFAGDVSLGGVQWIDGTIVVAGSVKKQVSKNDYDSVPVLWGTQDYGQNWVKSEVEVSGSTDTSVADFIIAPDGSWNLLGQAYQGGSANGARQFSVGWLRSVDGGDSFELMYPDALDADYDQGYDAAAFSADASAIVGWDERSEEGEDVSALWTDLAGDFTRVASDGLVPVEGEQPAGEFLSGAVFYKGDLLVWGSPTGDYPTDVIRFWKVTEQGLSPVFDLEGSGVYVSNAQVVGDGLLLGGMTLGTDRDPAVWYGTL